MKNSAPVKVCCLLLFLIPLAILPGAANYYELPKIVLFRVLTLVLFGMLVWDGMLSVPDVLRNKHVRYLFIGILIMLGISLIFSIAPKMSFWGSYFRGQGVFQWIHYLIFFLVLTMGNLDFKKLWKWVFAGLFFSLVFAVSQYLFVDLNEISLGRAIGTFGQPNYLGYYILLLIFPLFSKAIKEKKLWQLGLLGLGIFGIILSESRGAMIGSAGGALIYILLSGNKKWLVAGLVTAVIGSVLTIWNWNHFLSRSVETRLSVWESSLEMISEKPVFGYGIETFPMAFQKFAKPELLELEKLSSIPDKAHNIFIETAAESGIVGLALLIYGMIVVFGLGIGKRNPEVIGILSSLGGAFVANQFGFFATTHFVIATFLLANLAILLSKKRIKREIKLNKIIVVVLIVLSIVFQNLFVLVADIEARNGHLITATMLNPNQRDYNYILASAYNDASYAEKGGEFTSFNDPYYYYLLGKILKSEDYFRQAFEMSPTYPPILLEWGKIHLEAGDCEKALGKFNEYLRLVPDDWDSSNEEAKRIFYKENPKFDEVFNYINQCKDN